MADIILKLFEKLISESSELMESLLSYIAELALGNARILESVFGIDLISALEGYIFKVAISLIVFKFVKKGFYQYILWTDGDADNDFSSLVINFILAIVLAVSFHSFYNYGMDIALSFLDGINDSIGINYSKDSFSTAVGKFAYGGGGLVVSIFLLVYIIILIILFFRYLKTCIELLIIRIAFPLVASGMMDYNSGSVKTFLQKIIQIIFGIILQLVLIKLSLSVVIRGLGQEGVSNYFMNIIFAIAILTAAMGVPKFLHDIVLVNAPTGGGGKLQKTYYITNMLRQIRRVIR